MQAKVTNAHRNVRILDLPKWLANQVERFREANQALEDPLCAYGNCGLVSEAFILMIKDYLLDNPQVKKPEPLRVASMTRDAFYKKFICKNDCGRHWVSRVGDIYVDWTARQYSARFSFPRIWRM